MNFDPSEIVEGFRSMFTDEHGLCPVITEDAHRFAEILASVMNEDGVYSKSDLYYAIKDMIN